MNNDRGLKGTLSFPACLKPCAYDSAPIERPRPKNVLKEGILLAVKSKGGVEVLHKAEVQLRARHSAERILRCWGGQSKGSFAELKEGIHKMLQVLATTSPPGHQPTCQECNSTLHTEAWLPEFPFCSRYTCT